MTRARNQGPSGPLAALSVSATLPHPGGLCLLFCCPPSGPAGALPPRLVPARGTGVEDGGSTRPRPIGRLPLDIPQDWARLMARQGARRSQVPARQGTAGLVGCRGIETLRGRVLRPWLIVSSSMAAGDGGWSGPTVPKPTAVDDGLGALPVWVATGASPEAIGSARS